MHPELASFKRQEKLHRLLESKDHFFLNSREHIGVCHMCAASATLFSCCSGFPSCCNPACPGTPHTLLFRCWQIGEGRGWPCTWHATEPLGKMFQLLSFKSYFWNLAYPLYAMRWSVFPKVHLFLVCFTACKKHLEELLFSLDLKVCNGCS